jgi:hypothetical protein
MASWGAPQPPKRKRLVPILIGTGAFIVTLGIIGALTGGGKKDDDASSPNAVPAATVASTPAAEPSSAPAAVPAPTTTPPPTTPPKPDTVTYVVTGSASDITYGPAGTSLSGDVPLKVTKPLGHPSYYSISAQLQGSGHVTCKIEVNGKVISQAEAAGSYNIAMCEIVQDFLSDDWVDANAG